MTLNSADDTFIAALKAIIPDSCFVTDESVFEEPRGRYKGQGVLLAPYSTAEVSRILRACNAARVGVVPHGGGTGLVGAQVMVEGPVPVVLSTRRLNRLRGIYPEEGMMVAEAGCILADLQGHAADAGKLFALSLGSEGSARIGGLLSTNAGGLNVLRYGNARAQCLGLEVVLPDGQIWNGLTRLHKDNTGYDLRDLFIGAEGTLGLITAAALKLAPRPAVEGSALMAVRSPEAALTLLSLVRDRVGEGVSGFELISHVGFDFLVEAGMIKAPPISGNPEWQVLMRLGLSVGADADEALTAIYAEAEERGLVYDGIIAQSAAQSQHLWDLRETIPEGNRFVGSIASHDVSLPLSRIAEFIPLAKARIAEMNPALRINCFGHLGDGNLHFNVFPPKGEKRAAYDGIRSAVSRAVHDLVMEMEGSFSAEHGVGRLKVEDLERYADPAKLFMMRRIKESLDPHNIMNPGALLRA